MERQPKDFVEDKAKQVEVAPPPWENFTRSNPSYGKTPAGKPTSFKFSSHYYDQNGKGNYRQNKAAPSSRNVAKESKQVRKLRLSGLGLTYRKLGQIILAKVPTTNDENSKAKVFLTPKEYRKVFGKKKTSKKAKSAPTPNRGPKAPRIRKKDKSQLNKKQIVKAVVTQENVGHNYQKPTRKQKRKARKEFLVLQKAQSKKTAAKKAKKRLEQRKQTQQRIQTICGDWHSVATDWRFLQLLNSNLIQGDC